MTPAPAELAAAMETVRKPRPLVIHTKKGDLVGPDPKYAAACELLARWLAENAGRLRVVRPLEWVDREDASFASTPLFGQFCARSEKWTVPGERWFEASSREDAKAKAQAWYDERITAALAPAFPAKEGKK